MDIRLSSLKRGAGRNCARPQWKKALCRQSEGAGGEGLPFAVLALADQADDLEGEEAGEHPGLAAEESVGPDEQHDCTAGQGGRMERANSAAYARRRSC